MEQDMPAVASHYTHYLQVRQDLGFADHVWQDKRTLIAHFVDALGDPFPLAMRSGWISYVRRTNPEDSADNACPAVEDTC